ncbi:hypothetical protein BH11ARM1_BH11ARM1_11460 [soil metagenome]
MICALAVSLALLRVKTIQPQRLRTLTPGGACILVERVPTSKFVTVQLFAAAKGAPETAETNGQRHLLEHLVAPGDGTIDQAIETRGGYLFAKTMRDAMVFEIEIPTSDLPFALDCLRKIARKRAFTDSDIAKESKIIGEEGALRESSSELSQSAWLKSYGDRGGDPFGDLDVISRSTPTEMNTLQAATFRQSNLCLVISGDVDLDKATASGSQFLGSMPEFSLPNAVERKAGIGGPVSSRVRGVVLAVPVEGFRHPATSATLAAALVLASGIPTGFMTYTPSAGPGMVLFGSKQGTSLTKLAREAVAEELFASAKLIARRWVNRQLEDTSLNASFRGLLLVQENDLKPETMLENIDAMTLEEFRAALASFTSDQAVLVVGR